MPEPSVIPPDTREKEVASRHPIVWATLLVFAVYISWATWTTTPLQSANDRSRWCTVWSLVERGTYQIDEIDQVEGWSTIDKVRHQPKGTNQYHFYSSKPPLFPTMVAGIYWLQKHVLGMDLRQQTQPTAQGLLLLINVLPFCLALLAFEASVRRLKMPASIAAAMFAIAAFTSMLNPFLTTLNNHTPAATALMFCLAALIRIIQRRSVDPESVSTRDFAIVGFTAALVCCFELPAALFGLLSFFVVAFVSIRKTLVAYAPAALLPLVAFFVTNIICTDGIKPFYTYYGTEKYEYIHEGVPSYWVSPKGIDSNQEHPVTYLFHCVLGHHGLLTLTPLFLLALCGWWLILTKRQPAGWKLVGAIGVFLSVAILSFYLTRTQNYNYGGNTSGLRWMLWLTPFWWYAMTPIVQRLMQSGKGILILLIFAGLSAYSSADSVRNAWTPNWIFRAAERQGWINYQTKVADFNPQRLSVLHPSEQLKAGVYRFGGSEDAAGRAIRITVNAVPGNVGTDSVQAAPSAGDFWIWKLEALTSEQRVLRSADLVVSLSALNGGNKVGDSIRQFSGDVNSPSDSFASLPKADAWVVKILQGLMIAKPYQAASERYLKYRNSADEITAVRCDRGAARIRVQHPEHGPCWQRCDVFYCDEVPLGVARWTITLTSEKTGAVVRKEVWTCRDLP